MPTRICVHINECLLSKNVYLVGFTSAEVFYGSAPSLGRFYVLPDIIIKA